jgi:surfeit locus 1 family protein
LSPAPRPASPGARQSLPLPAWLLAVLIAAAALVLLALGFWQLDRLRHRRAENALIAARLEQPPLDLNTAPASSLPTYTPVLARGLYDFENEIVLRNRARLDSPGVHVLTPLRLAGRDEAVLVDRGWIPYTDAEPATRAAYQSPDGEVIVTGLTQPSQTRAAFFLPADPVPGPGQPRLDAWFWVNLDELGQQLPYPLLPYFVERAPSDPAVLPVSDTTLDLSDGPHLSYAIQWFAFAVILVAGSLALWRQRRVSRPSPL